MCPSSPRSGTWGKPSEGCISFSLSLQVLLVCIHSQKIRTSQCQQRRKCNADEPWALTKAYVGTARAENSGKLSSKLDKEHLLLFSFASGPACPCGDQTHPAASPERSLRICWNGAACGAASGFIKTWKQKLVWVKMQVALCVVSLQPLNCITMEMRLASLQDWKIPGNCELFGDFFFLMPGAEMPGAEIIKTHKQSVHVHSHLKNVNWS